MVRDGELQIGEESSKVFYNSFTVSAVYVNNILTEKHRKEFDRLAKQMTPEVAEFFRRNTLGSCDPVESIVRQSHRNKRRH